MRLSHIDLLVILLGFVVAFSLFEFLFSMVGVKFKIHSFPWKKWTIETISIILAAVVFYFLYEANIFDNDWIGGAICISGYFVFQWLLGRNWKQHHK